MPAICEAINKIAQGSDGPGHTDAAAVVLLKAPEHVTVDVHGEGGGGGGGSCRIEALELADPEVAEGGSVGELPRILSDVGTIAITSAMSGCSLPLKLLGAHKHLRAAYYTVLYLLFLCGVTLKMMPVWVSGGPPRCVTASNKIFWATLVLLLLALPLGTIGMN